MALGVRPVGGRQVHFPNAERLPRRRVMSKNSSRLTLAVMALAALASTAAAQRPPDLGPNASLNGRQVFLPDDPWNRAIDREPVDPSSDTLINSIGRARPLHPDFGASWNGGPFGIPYIVVAGNTPKVPVTFQYRDESDPGPYPIPPNAPIEGGPNARGDRHVLVIDRDHWKLYELFSAFPQGRGWRA